MQALQSQDPFSFFSGCILSAWPQEGQVKRMSPWAPAGTILSPLMDIGPLILFAPAPSCLHFPYAITGPKSFQRRKSMHPQWHFASTNQKYNWHLMTGTHKSQCIWNYRHRIERAFAGSCGKVFINLFENHKLVPKPPILTPFAIIFKSGYLLSLHNFSAISGRPYLHTS